MDKEIIEKLNERNRRMIDAIIKKAERELPGVLSMIGVYGSFCTGEFHEKSDLDLLILINDDRGWALSHGFLLGDVGFDLYCTTWESLESDAAYTSPNISKLMDSKIVYCPKDEDRKRLEVLREKVRKTLSAPMDEKDIERVKNEFKEAELAFSKLMRAGTLTQCREQVVSMLYSLENAVALLNKTYFKRGGKAIFEEFAQMEHVPQDFEALVKHVVLSQTVEELKAASCALMRAADDCFARVKACVLPKARQTPVPDDLRGTYEEMTSNWKQKMRLCAKNGDAHTALMCLASLQSFFDDLAAELQMPRYDAMACFDPGDLGKTADAFDRVLEEYRGEYDKIGLPVRRYETIEKFESGYDQVK